MLPFQRGILRRDFNGTQSEPQEFRHRQKGAVLQSDFLTMLAQKNPLRGWVNFADALRHPLLYY